MSSLKYKKIFLLIFSVLVAFIGLNAIWYPYQKYSATKFLESYQTSDVCLNWKPVDGLIESTRDLPCARGAKIKITKGLLGIGAHYTYVQKQHCSIGNAEYSGDILSIAFIHRILNDKSTPIGPQQQIKAC